METADKEKNKKFLRKRRLIPVILLVVMVSMMLSGCGVASLEGRSGFICEVMDASEADVADSAAGNFVIDITQDMYKSIYGVPAEGSGSVYSALSAYGNLDDGLFNISTITGKISSAVADSLSVESLQEDSTLSLIINSVKAVGLGVMFCVWFFSLVSQMAELGRTAEVFFKNLLQLLIGVILVENATSFTSAFMGLMDVTTLGNISNSYGGSDGGMWLGSTVFVFGFKITSSYGFALWCCPQIIVGFVCLIVPWIINLYLVYRIAECLIFRVLELTVRIILAPVPVGLTIHQGVGREVISYIKGLIGCVFMPVVLIVALAAMGTIMTLLKSCIPGDDAFFLVLIRTVLAQLIVAGFIGRAGDLSKEIMGR